MGAPRPQSVARGVEIAAPLVALVVRAVALSAFAGTPQARHPMVDAYTFWEQAQALFRGEDAFPEGYYQPPAYPWLLARLALLTGGPSLDAVRGVQLSLGVFTAWALARAGRRLLPGAPALGAAAGLLYALAPPAVLFEHELLSPAWTNACLGGLLLLGVRPDGSLGFGAGGAALARALGAGLCVGLATALHPTHLLLGGAVVLALGVASRTTAALRPAVLAFALGLAAPVAPTAWENFRTDSRLVLVSHNAGINFWIGNNPDWVETTFLRPGLPFRQLALEAQPDERDLPERNAWWTARTWEAIRADVPGWLGRLGAKALWSVSNTEIPRNEDFRCRTQAGAPLAFLGGSPVRYGLLFPLALVGAVAWAAAPGRRALVAAWVALHAPLVLFIVADRYRLSTLPALVLLAVAGVEALRGRVAARSARALLPTGLALGAGLVLPWWPLHYRTEMDPADCAYDAANLAYMDEDFPRAEALYREVVEAHPRDMGAHGWLAQLAARRQDWPAAIAHAEVVVDQFPDHFPTLKELGRYREAAGDKPGATEAYLRAYRVPGDRTATGLIVVRLLWEQGRTRELKELLDADPKLAAHPKAKEIVLGR